MELTSRSCAEIGVPLDLRWVSQGISGVAYSKTNHLTCMMGNGALLSIQYTGVRHLLELIWNTLNNFTFLWWYQCHSRLVRVFLGTLWSSIKKIKAPYVFDWEHGITVRAMLGNRASSLAVGEVSWLFSSCSGNLGYIFELRQWWPFKTRVCSATSGLLSS